MSNEGSAPSSRSSDDEGWADVEADEEPQLTIVSLVDDRVFTDAEAMLAYCKDEHRLDFLGIRNRLQLDFYGSIKLVNYSKCSRPHTSCYNLTNP